MDYLLERYQELSKQAMHDLTWCIPAIVGVIKSDGEIDIPIDPEQRYLSDRAGCIERQLLRAHYLWNGPEGAALKIHTGTLLYLEGKAKPSFEGVELRPWGYIEKPKEENPVIGIALEAAAEGEYATIQLGGLHDEDEESITDRMLREQREAIEKKIAQAALVPWHHGSGSLWNDGEESSLAKALANLAIAEKASLIGSSFGPLGSGPLSIYSEESYARRVQGEFPRSTPREHRIVIEEYPIEVMRQGFRELDIKLLCETCGETKTISRYLNGNNWKIWCDRYLNRWQEVVTFEICPLDRSA